MPKLRTRSHCIGLNAQAQHRIGRKPDANAYRVSNDNYNREH